MSRGILGPRTPLTASSAAPAWVTLGCVCLAAVPAFIVWAGARVAAALAGGHVAGFGFGFTVALAGGHTRTAWPGVPTPLVITCAAILAAAAAAALWAARAAAGSWLLQAADDPVAVLARGGRDHARLTMPGAAARAAQLRASLRGQAPGGISEAAAGMMLGDLAGRQVPGRRPPAFLASWEDTVTAFMGPRAGKTTALAIPLTLDAPGAVLATSNKADLWAATHAIRRRAGRVWLFDPCAICYQPQEFWWDALAGITTVEAAHRLASHFVLTVEDPSKRELWGPAAQSLLTALFLAAASSERTLDDVARWLDQPANPAPATLLADAGFANLASLLTGTQNGAHETRDGIYETARTAAKSLRDQAMMRWVTPQRGLPCFRPADFPASTDTLFLLSESLSYASPLIAAITDVVIRAALRRAQQSGGRLDPPLPVILDEAANICRISDLPNLYSYLGSHGICPVTIMQSYDQGEAVWGQTGMAALFGASTIKLIGAGTDSPRLARDISTLIGQHDVPVRAITIGEGRISDNISLRRQDIAEPAAIRAITPGTAVLLASGGPPVYLRLRPWYRGPRRAEITANVAAAIELIRAGAAGSPEDQP